MLALHLANDDIHHAHLIAQDSEGVSGYTLLYSAVLGSRSRKSYPPP